MPAPVVIFGAFDRHNLGDLLFAHIAQSLLQDRQCIVTGLVHRDLTPWGGHQVISLSEAVQQTAGRRSHWVHAGGELLTCSNWEAAVMLQTQADATRAIALYDTASPSTQNQWAQSQTGSDRLAPYVLPRDRAHSSGRWIFNAVGGVDLSLKEHEEIEEVYASLRGADFIGVRDHVTRDALQEAGLETYLLPDPAVLIRRLFQPRISTAAYKGELTALRESLPNGYLAMQFSADFGDDATLDQLAEQLRPFMQSSGLGVILFRAGAAPWHDELEPYWRLQTRLPPGQVHVSQDLNIWHICALLAGSTLYCGSSLHGRIVAMAYGLPRINLRHPSQQGEISKQSAYAETWEIPGMPGCVAIHELAEALPQALALTGNSRLSTAAREWEERYLQGAAAWLALLD